MDLRGGFRIGRLFGIDIRLDASWLIIFVLILISLAGHFGIQHEDVPEPRRWGLAAAATLLFFFCILIHELSHSLVARVRGMDVHGITLFIFGGVSHLKGEPKRPRDEFLMAIVGPLASALLAGIFWFVAVLLPKGSLEREASEWLGTINLVLAAFNLVPGFPLDGGRVFRAVAWAATHDFKRATRLAGAAGTVVAYLLILGGVVVAFGLGLLVSGLWLGFIGWFLLSAARSSVTQAEFKEILEQLRVSDVARTDFSRVAPSELVSHVVEQGVRQGGERTFFVFDGEHWKGVVTLNQIRPLPQARWSTTPVERIMIPASQKFSVTQEDSLLTALDRMESGGAAYLPVLRDGAMVAVLLKEDLLHRAALNVELSAPART